MAHQRTHTHPCQDCGVDVECGGTWKQNHDGFPEVICREFHQPGGFINSDYRCDTCHAAYWAHAGSYAEL